MSTKKQCDKSCGKSEAKKAQMELSLTAYRQGKSEAYDEAARMIDSARFSAYDCMKVSSELRTKAFEMRKPL